ncbi:putative ammecr1 family protein [Lasiodiplodia theobromae]|nr:putative ammecr1 family protein [Lasiodiplodia theobromae]
MATAAHCAYCFESLSASLEKRHPLSLEEVEELWNNPSTNASTSSVQSAASSRSSAPTTASSATSKSSSRTSFFSSLGRRVRGAQSSSSAPAAASDDAYPLFVTWNTLSRSGSKNLRGCIGTFEDQELSDGLRSYALTSAFDDTRFNPIATRELPSLECGVTLLTNFQPAADAMAWELGKHGLRISFTYHGRRYGATYLPDVAKEQGWTKEETIVSLMRKAGWSGRRDDWRKVDLNVITYEGSKATLAYAEWKEWRDWVEERAGVAAKALN